MNQIGTGTANQRDLAGKHLRVERIGIGTARQTRLFKSLQFIAAESRERGVRERQIDVARLDQPVRRSQFIAAL